MIRISKSIILVSIALSSGICLADAQASKEFGTVRVEIEGYPSEKGIAMVAIERDSKAFDDGKLEEFVFKGYRLPLNDKKLTVEFKNLPYGTYAIKTFHDENENSKLDTNFFGVPSEAYGFSNNARGSFGPASFSDAKFELNKSQIDVRIKIE